MKLKKTLPIKVEVEQSGVKEHFIAHCRRLTIEQFAEYDKLEGLPRIRQMCEAVLIGASDITDEDGAPIEPVMLCNDLQFATAICNAYVAEIIGEVRVKNSEPPPSTLQA